MGDSRKDTITDWSKVQLTSDELIKKLRTALKREGDFPASAKIVGELRQLTSDPKTSANQITELILREPSLGVRVLHLVNSSFYRRAKPIMTVSQAVVQIGMKPLAEMCAGLVLLQKFVPAARRGGSFANCLRKTVLTSLLCSAITPASSPSSSQRSRTDEHGYLAGSFAELGTLLLAFYFPQIYEAAVRRAESKKQEVSQSIREITGLSPVQLSLEVLEALELPSFYKEILKEVESASTSSPQGKIGGSAEAHRVALAVAASSSLSEAMVSNKSDEEIEKVIGDVKAKYGFEPKVVSKVLGDLPRVFKDHCSSLDLQLPAISDYKPSGSGAVASDQKAPVVTVAAADKESQFNQFVQEIRQAVESREPTASVITTVMETFAWSLGFERVLLMLVSAGKTKLVGRMLLGNVPNFDPKRFERPLGSYAQLNAPDARAFREARPIFGGEPLFRHGWPIAAIPIGYGARAIGVIYADRDSSEGGDLELSAQEQAAVGILAELLDRSISLQS